MTDEQAPDSALKVALKTAFILFLFFTVFTSLLSGAYLSTHELISEASDKEKMRLIDDILPPSYYDNRLLQDSFQLPAEKTLGLEAPSTVYRARKKGKTVAVVLEAVALDGYAGQIRLILAIDKTGTVLGTRVTHHKETPGLGDYIDPKKDKNKTTPWITQFNGENPSQQEAQYWGVKKEGGHFDALAGATVSPRAVIKAVRKAGLFVTSQRALFFEESTSP